MDQVACDICTKDYDHAVTVPRVMPCGHTLCRVCMVKVFRSSVNCPKCRADLSSSALPYFPVNYSLLGMIESLKNTEPMRKHLKTRNLEDLDEELCRVEATIRHNMTTFSSMIRQLEDELDSETTDSNIQSLNEQLDGLDLDEKRTNPFRGLKASSMIKHVDNETPKEFLAKIHRSVLAGDRVYAVSIVEETIKHARVSAENDRLIIHAFDRPVKDPLVKTVWFQDIKNCMNDEPLQAFFELGTNANDLKTLIWIQPRNSHLIPQIFSLFTGEIGPVYSGLRFHTEVLSGLTSWVLYIEEVYEESMNYEYSPPSEVEWTPIKDYLVVIGTSSGTLVICRAPKEEIDFANVIGTVVEGLNHPTLNLHNCKVFDCGISVNITNPP